MNGRFLINRSDAKVMGVAAGLADYTGVDPTIVRLGIVALTLLTGPVMILFYILDRACSRRINKREQPFPLPRPEAMMQAVDDPYNLQRFVDAQDAAFEEVLAELGAGWKQSHWMWFIFPQLAGLGRSTTAQFYAVASLDEARAYLAHPLLG